MFGYIKPFKPQLRMCEYDTYKAVYCGLCGQMGKSFGAAARMTLSYDFTFLCLMHYAVSGGTPTFSRGRCHVNPFKRVSCCRGDDALRFSADTAVIMIYYKLLDNMQDQRGFSRLGWRLCLPAARRAYRKAAAGAPECAALVGRSIDEQNALEAAGEGRVDAACEPSARAMAGVCRLLGSDEKQRRILERLGYCIGRFVYLCDALDDLEDDIAAGGYNPYALSYGLGAHSGADERDKVYRSAKQSLYGTIAEAGKAYELLDITKFEPILSNVLFLGMRASVDEILAKKEKIQ